MYINNISKLTPKTISAPLLSTNITALLCFGSESNLSLNSFKLKYFSLFLTVVLKKFIIVLDKNYIVNIFNYNLNFNKLGKFFFFENTFAESKFSSPF